MAESLTKNARLNIRVDRNVRRNRIGRIRGATTAADQQNEKDGASHRDASELIQIAASRLVSCEPLTKVSATRITAASGCKYPRSRALV